MIQQNMRLVDVVVEMLDARIPYSSRNPDIDGLAGAKSRVIVLNKAGLADEGDTRLWRKHYENMGYTAVACDCTDGKGIAAVVVAAKSAAAQKRERLQAKGRIGVTVRAMVLGIPNVGKSTLINKIARRSAAATADRPGVTRDKQWIKADGELEFLDTPGVLWHKFDDERVGLNLAMTGAINDSILDTVQLAKRLLMTLSEIKPNAVSERYGTETAAFDNPPDPDAILAAIGKKRGFLLKGGVIDELRAAVILLDEFRGGKLGRVTLEKPFNHERHEPHEQNS
jgi:ribosome biogenesis GTPase A